MPTLAEIYSAIDSAKRRGSDFVRNPGASLQQMLGYANDRARVLNEQTSAATQEFIDTGKLYGPKSEALAMKMAEGYNPAGIFIGPNAAIFNKGMAAKALQMEKAGASPEDIWSATGTFRGPDKQWRQEISDKESALTEGAKARFTPGTIQLSEGKFVGSVPKAIEHPQLMEAYPSWMKDIEVRESPMLEGGSFVTREHILDPNRRVGIMQVSQSGENPKSTMLHEIQHAIQNKEGFARGGSVERVAKNFMDYANPEWIEYAKSLPNYKNQLTPTAKQEFIDAYVKMRLGHPEDVYLKLAGEAEARAVQNRMDMTDQERRATYPYKSYDVPLKDLIVKYR
jgi:hypothetical protein